MKLDIDFTNLENLVKNMGASSVIWKIPITAAKVKTEFGEIDFTKLATTGVIIDLNDVNFESDGRATTPDGEQILLHIKDVNSHYGLPKFHFSQCRTLKDMENKGKFEKYVMTQRKDGYFFIDKKIGYNEYKQNCEEKLDVCKNCLNWYNKNYHKHYSVETFDIVEFFEHFDQSPIYRKPTHTDTSAPKSGYTQNWDLISRQRKEQCGYICQQCGIDLNNHKNLVQTHHANGVKSDNSSSNLKVLCIECHSNQPSHGHMKSSTSREILEVQQIKARSPLREPKNYQVSEMVQNNHATKSVRQIYKMPFDIEKITDTQTDADTTIQVQVTSNQNKLEPQKVNDVSVASEDASVRIDRILNEFCVINSLVDVETEKTTVAVPLLKDEATQDFEDMF